MKFVLCVVLVGLLSFQNRAATQPPSGPQIPVLTAPDGATQLGKGGHGYAGARTRPYEFQLTSELSSAEAHYRISASIKVPEVAAHYVGQLVKSGWTVKVTRSDAKVAHVRLTVGVSPDTVIGTLIVVPLEATNVLVSCRLIRPSAPWRDGSRAGGGGANAGSLTVAFGQLSPPLKFPIEVVKAETRSVGGNRDYEYAEMRLVSSSAPAALMAHLQAQLPKDGWAEDGRISYPDQELVVRRNAGEAELWQITALPVTRETDALVARIR